MKKATTLKKRTLNYILLAWIVVIMSSKLPGLVEGKLFPVISEPSINIIANPRSNATDTIMQYEELRNCNLNSITWVKERSDGTRIRVSSFVDDKQILDGVIDYQKRAISWTMLTSSTLDLSGSNATLEYNCHGLWPTYMRIYDLE